MSGYGYYGGWAPYVSVAKRRQQAATKIKALQKKGRSINPVQLDGHAIAKTFWGKSWCTNLEAYSDYSNRLPRGRSYVRNGAVLDLHIGKGKVTALVAGSSVYTVDISIRALEKERWQSIIEECSGQIDSLIELLQGKFSKAVMGVITDTQKGLFPSPRQISMNCSCPDGAVMCKHVAATLYGVGARLDEQPELFFELRHVDHLELIAAGTTDITARDTHSDKALKSQDLSRLFGIELDSGSDISAISVKKSVPPSRAAPKKKSNVPRSKPQAIVKLIRKKCVAKKKTKSPSKKKR